MYVSTIHPSHLPNTLAMLEKAKPVLCEKPLTMNARDTAVLIKFARDKGVFLMEVHCKYTILYSGMVANTTI